MQIQFLLNCLKIAFINLGLSSNFISNYKVIILLLSPNFKPKIGVEAHFSHRVTNILWAYYSQSNEWNVNLFKNIKWKSTFASLPFLLLALSLASWSDSVSESSSSSWSSLSAASPENEDGMAAFKPSRLTELESLLLSLLRLLWLLLLLLLLLPSINSRLSLGKS